MSQIFFAAALVAVGAVVAALFLGLLFMGRGTENAQRLSQRMMRARVVAQGVAIVFLLLAYLTKK